MNFLHHSKSQKLCTCFLLALLVFVNGVKTFHTHNFSYSTQSEQQNNNSFVLKANFSCTICDFQIAKDSDAEIALAIISTPVVFVEACYNYISAPLTSLSIVSSVRGPPAVC